MAGNLVISQINGGPIGVINAIINGNFQVNQRGVSGTVTLAARNQPIPANAGEGNEPLPADAPENP